MVITTIHAPMQLAIPDISEADITGKPTVLQDLEMLEQDQCTMGKPDQTREIFFFVQLEVSAIKPEIPEQQGLHAEFHQAYQQAANRAAAGIVQAFNSLVIVIKLLRR
jgi:predicted  nucleic acid-binding Zn ribbon protein